jgi:flavin reductase
VAAEEPPVDPAAYRHVMSRLAGGVTVVATVDTDGTRHGMTVNTVTSVSLDPVLVLFCCERDASLHDPVLRAGAWTVSMLTSAQTEVSRWFAARERRGTDQFGSVAARAGAKTGMPILDDAVGWLECRTWATYDGGDHTIVVGSVLDLGCDETADSPLLYFKGGYRTLS